MKPTIDPFLLSRNGAKLFEALETVRSFSDRVECKSASSMEIPQPVGQAGGWLGHEADSSRVEVARALIARVKAADSSIDRRDELWYASDSDALDRRDWHVRRVAPADTACAWAMGR